MIASVQGGMFADKADGITAEEDFQDKAVSLCRTLERENQQLRDENKGMSIELGECTKHIFQLRDELKQCVEALTLTKDYLSRTWPKSILKLRVDRALSLSSIQLL